MRTTLTPFGTRQLVYVDWTASGKSLGFVEEFMAQYVMPTYANTHTTSSLSGANTMRLREEARATIKSCLNGSDQDVLLFAGSVCTGSVKLFMQVLELESRARSLVASGCLPADCPAVVVFVGPYEHHSNLLPWRELRRSLAPESGDISASSVVIVPIKENMELGGVDLEHLEDELLASQKNHHARTIRIGTFSAASNITGLLSDTHAITRLLHTFGALACFDYAAAAPYVAVDANPRGGDPLLAKDAVFLSPHKFVGGPNTPGILLMKRRLCLNSVPSTPGGGTVVMVLKDSETYTSIIEEREEGGTPDILGSIRAGLVFQLKQQVGVSCIARKEHAYQVLALRRLRACRNIVLLGHPTAARVCIFSFLVRFSPTSPSSPPSSFHRQQFLHHAFVATLLNDLFGLQTRSGCMCAGPYATGLLRVPTQQMPLLAEALNHGIGLFKPGQTRFNLNWFVSEAEINYVLDAIAFVAEHGWRFLPLYSCNSDGDWWHSHLTLPSPGEDAGWKRHDGPEVTLPIKGVSPLTHAQVKAMKDADGPSLHSLPRCFQPRSNPAWCEPTPSYPADVLRLPLSALTEAESLLASLQHPRTLSQLRDVVFTDHEAAFGESTTRECCTTSPGSLSRPKSVTPRSPSNLSVSTTELESPIRLSKQVLKWFVMPVEALDWAQKESLVDSAEYGKWITAASSPPRSVAFSRMVSPRTQKCSPSPFLGLSPGASPRQFSMYHSSTSIDSYLDYDDDELASAMDQPTIDPEPYLQANTNIQVIG